jgi:hypothetical protein
MKDLTEFQKELEILINKHGVDEYCNAHGFVLVHLITQNIVQIAVMNETERRLRGEEG